MNHFYRLPGGDVAALEADSPFPPLEQALTAPDGLLAIGGELSSERLLDAYRRGIFPWFSAGEPVSEASKTASARLTSAADLSRYRRAALSAP